jgi:hypothetical protein
MTLTLCRRPSSYATGKVEVLEDLNPYISQQAGVGTIRVHVTVRTWQHMTARDSTWQLSWGMQSQWKVSRESAYSWCNSFPLTNGVSGDVAQAITHIEPEVLGKTYTQDRCNILEFLERQELKIWRGVWRTWLSAWSISCLVGKDWLYTLCFPLLLFVIVTNKE